jgi:hypothetical protein
MVLAEFGPGSSVGIATGYGLDYPGIESRWGSYFPQLSRPAWCLHSLLYIGTGSFPGVESGRGVTPRSKNRIALYHYSP